MQYITKALRIIFFKIQGKVYLKKPQFRQTENFEVYKLY